MTMYGFISFINHGKPNICHSKIEPFLNIWTAKRDIQAGEQIFLDYIETITDKRRRRKILKATWGINQDY